MLFKIHGKSTARIGVYKMQLEIVRNSTAKIEVDAVINTANKEYSYSKDIRFKKSIIYRESFCGKSKQQSEQDKIGMFYQKCIQSALKKKCKSIAIPFISVECSGYQKIVSIKKVLNRIENLCWDMDIMIYLVAFDKETFRLSGKTYIDILKYIKKEYKEESECINLFLNPKWMNLEYDFYYNGETFQQHLLRLIRESGRDEADVYQKAQKDKKFFNEIKNDIYYHPMKHTVFAFAVSLQLSLGQTKSLLMSEGFGFLPCRRFDLIMQYFFEKEIYDMYTIDCILNDFGEEKLFSSK